MALNKFKIILILICTLHISTAIAAGVPTEEPKEVSDAVPLIKITKPIKGGYIDTHQRFIAAIQEDQGKLSTSAHTINSLLDLTDFYIEHGMIVEGLSILTAIEPTELSPEQENRKIKSSVILNILNPLGMHLTPVEIKELETRNNIDNSFVFKSFYYTRIGKFKLAKTYLELAATEAPSLNNTIQELVLPKLLDVAISTNEWAAAKKFAVIISKHRTLSKSSAYQYLLGRTAEVGEDYLTAFDHYVRASEGLDKWAQIARIALIEMGMNTKTLTLQDAQKLLKQSRSAWHGDALATKTRNLLVDVEIDLLQTPEALEILAEIIYNNLDDASVNNAKERAIFLLDDYYENGVSGNADIAQFLIGHKRIASDYRFQKGFDVYSEKFADKFFSIGASSEAAREYETTYNYLSVARDLGIFEVSSTRLDTLRIKQLRALIRGGQYEEAASNLAYGAESKDPDIVSNYAMLKVTLYNLTGKLQSILDTKVQKETTDYLRLKANAYYSMADWRNAATTYTMLWEHNDSHFEFTDAINTLLAAYHIEDVELASRLVKIFPSLTETPQWREIAMGLFDKNNKSDILQKDMITESITDADKMLEVMNIINPQL